MPTQHVETTKSHGRRAFLLVSALFLIVILGVLLGIWVFRSDLVRKYYRDQYEVMLLRYPNFGPETAQKIFINSVTESILPYTSALLGFAPIEKLNLAIDPRDFVDIKQERETALNSGEYQKLSGRYFSALLYPGDENNVVEAKLRIKGERRDHLSHPTKWSYRIKTKSDETIFGMHNFSIQGPHTREYQYEPVFLKSMRDFGVLAVRYMFVDAQQNGQPIGLMALEEHFEKDLLVAQGRREGPIFKIDDRRIPDLYFRISKHPLYIPLMQEIEEKIESGSLPSFYRNVALHVSG
ncbi:MAG: hypothetical protein KDD53_09395, partial [Bdellovibrionales bacterium]|nr:hypothetical protein [Bdellovibrionales bacterium]